MTLKSFVADSLSLSSRLVTTAPGTLLKRKAQGGGGEVGAGRVQNAYSRKRTLFIAISY